jgi:hypothetical protein
MLLKLLKVLSNDLQERAVDAVLQLFHHARSNFLLEMPLAFLKGL